MKKTFTLIALLFFSILSFAQTEISGIVDSDTTWTVNNGPYIITGNLLVNDNVTLTIEPGVELRFTQSTRMVIQGTVVARGTQNSKIKFTSNQSIPESADWEGIIIKNEAEDALFDDDGNYVSGCIFEYCVIEYTGDTVYDATIGGAIKIDDSSPFITYTVFQNNNFSKKNEDGGALAIRGSAYPIIRFNYIVNNDAVTGGGICIRGGGGTIENNYFGNNDGSNKGGAIYIWGTNSNLILKNNVMESNTSGKGGAVYLRSTSSSTDVYKGNSFINNSEYEVYREFLADITKDFTGNFWNTTVNDEIPTKIYDFYDDFEPGIIAYEGFLEENDIEIYDPNVTSTIDQEISYNVKMYPNPTNDLLIIESDREIKKVNILGLNGQLIKSFNITNTLNVNGVDPGIYLVQLHLSDTVICRKIVVQ